MAITKRQLEVLDFIAWFIENNRYSPTYGEIGQGIGVSSMATVHKHVQNLWRKGLIESRFNHSRSIAIRDKCPTCGHSSSNRRKEFT